VLLQRAARGRDELELRRLDEAEKRGNRFRCMVQVRVVADLPARQDKCSTLNDVCVACLAGW
jgi:hypothetical protein